MAILAADMAEAMRLVFFDSPAAALTNFLFLDLLEHVSCFALGTNRR